MDPTVSVVIPTYDRLPRLRRVLAGLAAQDVDRPFEVVVVDDGSTDGTGDYLRSGAPPLPVVTSTQGNQGPGAARNRGVDLATGDIVVFLDDDVIPDPGLVRAHVRAHERHGDRTVVIGPMRNPPDHQMSPWIRWEQAMLAKQYDAMEAGQYDATARQFFTGNASLRREHILAAGGFDPALRRAEDVELAYRLDTAGLGFVYEPDAVGLHYAERSFRSWLEAGYAYGRNDVVFGRDRGKPEVLSRVAEEYRRRHLLTRLFTRTCATRPRVGSASTAVLRRLAAGCSAIHLTGIASKILSGIYNMTYYRGVADELGGADQLIRLLEGGDSEAPA